MSINRNATLCVYGRNQELVLVHRRDRGAFDKLELFTIHESTEHKGVYDREM